MRNSIKVNIRELRLEGFEPDRIQATKLTLEQELNKLVTEGGLSTDVAGDRMMTRETDAPVELPTGSDGTTLGAHVAQAIYRRIMR
jgi:hypothetical protein